MKASLAAARDARKRSELNVQLLANRIALLKQEEEKAWKRIEDTRRKTATVVASQAERSRMDSSKEQLYKAQWESMRAAQEKNSADRERARAQRTAARNGVQRQRAQSAQSQKARSRELLAQKRQQDMASREANSSRSTMARESREDMRRTLEQSAQEKLRRFREESDARVAQEVLLHGQTEQLVASMEREELELIQRLQVSQNAQRSAIEELAALTPPRTPASGSQAGSARRPQSACDARTRPRCAGSPGLWPG